MSDVSGIPYMGPMGQGNFFAPQFSYNPQINPTAGYAGPVAYNQNVTNNLYSSGGGFGTQTAYYAGLGASYGRQIAPSYENPYAGGGVPASLAYPGASLSGGYTTGAANMPSFDTGPNFGYTSGGAGALDLSQVGNPFSGGLGGGGGGYSGPTIDWSNVGRAAADPSPGMSAPGGLGSPLGAPSGASPFNWSDLWGGGGGSGGYSSGIAPDTTGGRTSSVDWNNISSPPTSYGTFQGGGGGDGGYTSGIAPDTAGGRDFIGSPLTTPEVPTKSQDQAPFDLSGPTTGWNNAPASMPNSERLLGYDPQKGPVDFDPNTFVSPSTNYDTFQAPVQDGGGGGTDKIVEEARQRLAGIIGSPETAKAVESPATDYSKFQQPGTAATDALRPPDKVDTSLEGRIDALRNTLKKEIEAQGLYMTSDYRGPGHELYRPGSQHSNALAFDTRAKTPEQADAAKGQIKELFEARGMKEGRDFTFIDEVRHPILGITKGPHLHTTLTPEGMERYQRSAYDVYNPDGLRPPQTVPPTEPPPEPPAALPSDMQRPPAGVFPEARLAPNGQEPTAFVVHHTEGRPTLESVVNYWRSGSEGRGEGIGAQYFLDRNGVVHDVAAKTGYTGTSQTKSGNIPGSGNQDLNNSNVVGIEVSARNTADMTPKQIAALNQFVEKRYPNTAVYGHAEIDSGKDRDEGVARANEILDARVAANPNMFPSPGFWDQLDAQKADAVPLPASRPAAANTAMANDTLDTRVGELVRKYSPGDAGRIPSDIAGQTLREAMGNPFSGSTIRSGIPTYLPKIGVSQAEFDKAYNQGRVMPPRASGSNVPNDDSWAPQEGTPEWNAQVYQPSDARGIMRRDESVSESDKRWSEFRRSDNVEDRRDEQLPPAELAALRLRGFGYAPMSEPTPSPLSKDLGLGDLPTPRGTTAGKVRPQGAGDFGGDEGDTFNDRLGPFGDTNMRDFPSPATDYSAFQQPASRNDLATLVPLPQPRPENIRHMDEANRELGMTPQEQALYERHLSNLFGPGGVNNPPTEENPNGSRSTLYQSNVEIDGKNYNIPTVYDGKIVSVAEAVERAKAQGLDKFPSYATPEAGEERYMKMHDYMDRDVGDYFDKHGGSLFNQEGPPAPPQASLEPDNTTGMRDFQSPSTDHSTFQQLTPIPAWQASLPPGRNGPEVVEAVKAMAARLRTDPAEIAALVQQETHDSPSALWNPQITPNRYGYRGLTQMGRDTFTDATRLGMPIGSFPTIEDYQRGTAEQQIAAYGDWLDLYTLQNPQGAAAFVNSGGLAGLPPGEAAAVLQGTQFAPNAAGWVRGFEQGDRDMPTTATRQAPELRSKSINDMTAAARSHMAAWPQQQLWSDYNMPRRPGGY